MKFMCLPSLLWLYESLTKPKVIYLGWKEKDVMLNKISRILWWVNLTNHPLKCGPNFGKGVTRTSCQAFKERWLNFNHPSKLRSEVPKCLTF